MTPRPEKRWERQAADPKRRRRSARPRRVLQVDSRLLRWIALLTPLYFLLIWVGIRLVRAFGG